MTQGGGSGLLTKERGGVFFLYGEDRFRKEEQAKVLVAHHLDPATRDFNFDPLRGSEVTVENLASVLATPPMMAEWRVVLVREVEALASSSRSRDALMEVVKNPPPGLALILVATIPKGSQAKFYKDIIRLARSVEYREVSPHDLPGWVLDRARRRHGREFSEEAARALAAGVGTDLGALAQEVEKLANLVEDGEIIGIEAVREAGTQVPTEDRWLWMDRVGRREFTDALRGMEILFGQGESGVWLTTGLATHLIRVALAKAGGKAALDASLPRHQKFLIPKLLNQTKGWSAEGLEEAIMGLRRVDRLLKSSSLPDDQVMEEWLLGVMAREGAAKA
jgi:DNA polymerase-3 subunit delta